MCCDVLQKSPPPPCSTERGKEAANKTKRTRRCGVQCAMCGVQDSSFSLGGLLTPAVWEGCTVVKGTREFVFFSPGEGGKGVWCSHSVRDQ